MFAQANKKIEKQTKRERKDNDNNYNNGCNNDCNDCNNCNNENDTWPLGETMSLIFLDQSASSERGNASNLLTKSPTNSPITPYGVFFKIIIY